jgi:tetratricopeptide (TPR) repeat protein
VTRPGRPSPRCRALLLELSQYLDGDLPAARRRTIERHIHDCTCCGTMAARLRTTIAACRADGKRRPPRDVIARAAQRIRALIARKARRPAAVVLLLCLSALAAPARVWPAQDLVAQARRLDLDGRQDAAIALYKTALERDPASFDAHYGLARALDLTGDYADARRHFARAIALAPDGARDQALRMMAISYVFTGDAPEAGRYFEQVFDRHIAAASFDAAAEVANELGRVYLEFGNLDGAAKWYGKGYETASRQANRAASTVDLVEFRWAHAQARIAARKGDAPEARRQEATAKQLLDKGTNQDQRPQYPYLLGYVHFFLKEYDGAIAELQKADQSDPFILALLGQAYEKTGSPARAREYYGKALLSSSHAVNNAFARRIARQNLDAPR